MSNEFLNGYIVVISITNTKVDGGFVVKYFRRLCGKIFQEEFKTRSYAAFKRSEFLSNTKLII